MTSFKLLVCHSIMYADLRYSLTRILQALRWLYWPNPRRDCKKWYVNASQRRNANISRRQIVWMILEVRGIKQNAHQTSTSKSRHRNSDDPAKENPAKGTPIDCSS